MVAKPQARGPLRCLTPTWHPVDARIAAASAVVKGRSRCPAGRTRWSIAPLEPGSSKGRHLPTTQKHHGNRQADLTLRPLDHRRRASHRGLWLDVNA